MRFLSSISPYYRLARLNNRVGIWLLFLPCLFGIFLSVKKLPNYDFFYLLEIIAYFFLGSVLMRSAGCVLNDIFDQDFDKKVKRTRQRPIASGQISTKQALAFLAILLFFSLLILLEFNNKTIFAGFASLILVIAYPLMKRITYFPQVFLGLTFNFGILLASLAILEKITPAAIILYLATIIWTLIYDTIYAFQDIEDDLKIGVKSATMKFQKKPKEILLFLNFSMFSLLLLTGYVEKYYSGYFAIILISSFYLTNKIKDCDFKNEKNCMKVFKDNILVGLLILLAIISG